MAFAILTLESAGDPANAALLKKFASVQIEAGQFEEAQAASRALVALTPDDAAAHLSLASALRRGGHRRDALVHARRAAELAPDNPGYGRYVEGLSRAEERR